MRPTQVAALLVTTALLSVVPATALLPPPALARSPVSDSRKTQAEQLSKQGYQLLQVSQFGEALTVYQQALKLYQQIGDRVGEGAALNNIGAAYRSFGQYSKALDFYQQALKLYQQIGDRAGEGITLNNIGAAYRSFGQYSKALDFYQQALQILQEVGDRAVEGITLSNIGLVYNSLGQYPKALDFLQQSLQILQEVRDRASEGITLNNIGGTLVQLGQYHAAEQPLFQAILIYEQLRPGLTEDRDKISLNDTQKDPYRWLQAALIAQNKTTVALEVAERGRTRAFVELLATRLSGNSHSAQTLQRLSQPLSLPQIQQVAKQQNATLVEYSVVRTDLYIWLVRPTGQIEFRKIPYRFTPAQLQELVSVTRGALRRGANRSGNSAAVSQTANARLNQFGAYPLRQLHQLLIQPIADLLPKNPRDRIVFIPQNELLLVPFAALLDAKGNYLIEQHTLLTAPSIQVLSLTEQNQQRLNNSSDRTALVVGNPTLPKLSSGFLTPLPAAEREARTVAQLLKTKPMIEEAANKATVINRMPQARFIHLATHGLLTFNNGHAPGAIVLAPDRPNQVNDGLLTPTETLEMQLKAELVVLSACDTAKGDVTSDGIVGLSRSLIAAGAPSVVVSLWNVGDESTSFLMSEFYRNLQRGHGSSAPHSDRAVALRQAMLTTMRRSEFASPYDWAAFTLIGEAK
ncbi:MAG: CHAT domain-containing protein [Plectolyngbya sp. WJT66-NPBG17]|jgi:CHAT domain-containing protein/Tfp pilus assembly protein PilF|nr:CHAT domain-containing protein [Plectolyngbya sp. WJT66-NPBG17]